MLDTRELRLNLDRLSARLETRGFCMDKKRFRALDERCRHLQTEEQSLRQRRKAGARKIGMAKAKGADIEPLQRMEADYGTRLGEIAHELGEAQAELQELLLAIPNLPDDNVPIGQSEADNREVKTWGRPRQFDFTPRNHVEMGAGLLDLEAAARISGSRFAVLRGDLARLHRALGQFMLDLHTGTHAYEEVQVPVIVRPVALYGTGQMPKFAEDLFRLEGEAGFHLIPTAEVPMTNLVREKILAPAELPLRLVCHSQCFRSEAGSHGRDTLGIIRQHQFEKVELVQVVPPEHSPAALEELTRHAETVLEQLQLPYRRVDLCTGDLGFQASRTHDLEVWIPSQNTYREISSCSNCLDFQARRMRARWRNPDTGRPELVHTLNGSGLAIGRTLVAVMENFQDEKGRVRIPEVLVPYMGGTTIIMGQ